jgi:DNA-binding response OmpR family regulator
VQRILAIDDDLSVRNVPHRGLIYEGFAVEVAETGEIGLSKARERLPDLVVLDRMMPAWKCCGGCVPWTPVCRSSC